MKHCRKDAIEPGCLGEFRESNPHADWERDFRNEGRDCYQQLRSELRRSQTCLCAYCEILLQSGNEQIAHFHPKSDKAGNRNWALDWRNLWLACKGGTRYTDQSDSTGEKRYSLPENRSCDEATEDEVLDGVILAPNEVPAFPRLFRYRQRPDGLDIAPDPEACDRAEIPVERVEMTIEKLNLNCLRLAEARLAVHRPLEREKRRLKKSGLDPMPALQRYAKRRLGVGANGCRQPFFTIVRWGLGQAAEDYLQASGFDG